MFELLHNANEDQSTSIPSHTYIWSCGYTVYRPYEGNAYVNWIASATQWCKKMNKQDGIKSMATSQPTKSDFTKTMDQCIVTST